MARTDIKDLTIDLTTIGGVISEVSRIKSSGSGVDKQDELHRTLESIYRNLGSLDQLDINDISGVERQLLAWKDELSTEGDEDKWLETKIDDLKTKESVAGSINSIKLKELLDEQERAVSQKRDRQSVAQDLAEKYDVKRSQVDEWLERVTKLEEQAKKNGLGEEVSRNVAEKMVVREERLADVLIRTSKATREEATDIARVLIDRTVGKNKLKSKEIRQIARSVKIERGSLLEVSRQTDRLSNEVEVVEKIDKEAKLFVGGLAEEMALSQPSIVFERYREKIEEVSQQAIDSVWKGKKDNLLSTEVVVNKGERTVAFVETVKDILETDDGTVEVAIKKVSGEVTADIERNVELAAIYEFVTRSEEIADEIVSHNPNIDRKAITDYSETIVEVSMPILAPGQRTSRQISGEYGLDEAAYVKTNILIRTMSGLSDYKEVRQVVEQAEAAGIGTDFQVLSPEGREVSSFLSQLRQNPLLEKGVTAIRNQMIRKVLTNSQVIEGVGSFVNNQMGFQAIAGIETATAIPAVMGFFTGGGTFGGAITGIAEAGSISGWINGLLVAGSTAETVGTTMVATGSAAATAGATAAAAGGTVAAGAGLTAAQAIPVVGQILLAVAAVVGVLKPIIKKSGSFLKDKLGIDLKKLNLGLKVKKFISEDLGLGNFVGGAAKFAIQLGRLLVIMPGMAVVMAFNTVIAMMAWLIPAIIGGLVIYMLFFVNPRSSTFGPTQKMIGGGQKAGNFDPNAPPLRAGDIVGECSVASHTSNEIKQNVGPWSSAKLPKGCTIADSGCGPTSMSIILRAKNSSLTPDVLISRSEYANAGCSGTSISQNTNVLKNELGGGVRIDGACSINSIARSICDGNKIVVILGNFYQDDSDLSRVGGHYVVAVGVSGGQIVTKDPFYSDNTPFLLEGEPVHAGAIHDIKGCIVINADRI